MSKTGTQKIEIHPILPSAGEKDIPVVHKGTFCLFPHQDKTPEQEASEELKREANKKSNALRQTALNMKANALNRNALNRQWELDHPDLAKKLAEEETDRKSKSDFMWASLSIVALAVYCFYIGHAVYGVALLCFRLLYEVLFKIANRK